MKGLAIFGAGILVGGVVMVLAGPWGPCGPAGLTGFLGMVTASLGGVLTLVAGIVRFAGPRDRKS